MMGMLLAQILKARGHVLAIVGSPAMVVRPIVQMRVVHIFGNEIY